MRKLVAATMVAWILLVVASYAAQAGSFMPTSVVRVNEIDLNYPAGGALEHAKMVLDEIGENPDYARVLVGKPTIKERAYGSVSRYFGWGAYVSVDALGSWKQNTPYMGGLC